MESPYEAEQERMLGRIVGTLEKLNESMLALNHAVAVRSVQLFLMYDLQLTSNEPQETNVYNSNVSEIVELWTTYTQNVKFNLSLTGANEEPI